jgi:transposase
MSRGRPAQAIKLSREDRKSLELLTRRGTAEHRQVVRAQIALMCHAGATTTAIAEAVGVSVQTVSHWRTRLARQGLKGLDEVARPGRPRRIGASQRLELLSLACEPAETQGRATATLDELVERAVERGVVTQISRSHLQRILQAGDLRPHRVRQWLHSPDPLFREKVNAICALYRQAPKGYPRARSCCRWTRRPGSRPSSASTPTARRCRADCADASSNTSATAPKP